MSSQIPVHPRTSNGPSLLLACAEPSFRFTVRGHEACASAFAGAFCGAACGSSRHRRSAQFALPCTPGETWRRTMLGCPLPRGCRGLAADATAGCRARRSCALSRPVDGHWKVARPFPGTPWMRSVAVRFGHSP